MKGWKGLLAGLVVAYVLLWIGGSMAYNYILPKVGHCQYDQATNTETCYRKGTQRQWDFWGPFRFLVLGTR